MDWFNKILGGNIKSLRKQAGYSQQQFAELLNLSRVSVMNIEAGRHCSPLFSIYTICCILNCEVSDIMPPIKAANAFFKQKVIVKKITRKVMKPINMDKPPFELNSDINRLRRDTGCPKNIASEAVKSSKYYEQQIAYIKKQSPKF